IIWVTITSLTRSGTRGRQRCVFRDCGDEESRTSHFAARPGAWTPGRVVLRGHATSLPGCERFLADDHQGTHHIVLLVLKNVAVPHILIHCPSCSRRKSERELSPGGSWAAGNAERHSGKLELHDHRRRFPWIHPD